MTPPPSGTQVELRRGPARAVVVEVGGGLREYDVAGRAVLDGYPADAMVTAARGQPLVPWPNRLHGGRYTWDGTSYDVPLDEPELGNALHGLCRYRSWSVRARSDEAVTMGLLLRPSPPYPFTLDLTVRYALTRDGLLVEHTATNLGPTAAPYAQGAHPYVTVGGQLDEALLTVPARTRVVTDDHQVPTGTEPVQGTAYDFRRRRRLGALQVDSAFTDLERGPDGRAVLALEAPGGPRVEVWVDQAYRWLGVFTGDTVPEEGRRRQGLATEPMTAPANAFVTGEGLVRLEPGATTRGTWGLRPG